MAGALFGAGIETAARHCGCRMIARYEMTRISAELHLNPESNESVTVFLEELAARNIVDPFSGNPYLYNEEKGVLYSVGKNGTDDSGVDGGKELDSGDIIIQCGLPE